MGAKVQIKNDSVHNFGWFYYCFDHSRRSGLVIIIDNPLDVSGVFARISYSKTMEALMSIYFTGESQVEDAKRLSYHFSKKTQDNGLCSHPHTKR